MDRVVVDSPQVRVTRLRAGLHVLIVVLVLVVLLRAALLSEPSVGWIGLLACVFAVLYIVGTAYPQRGALRIAWMVALTGLWLALTLVGADAAYVSFGLFLLFVTELSLRWALAAVLVVTAVNISIGVWESGPWGAAVAGSVFGAVVAIVIGLGFRVLFDETERRQALIEDLRRTRAALADRERSAGELAERQRLAQEIHDTVAQGLSSIQMLLHAAEAEPLPARAAEKVALARQTASASLADARGLVAALAPADLVGSSLIEALSRVCERAAGATDVRLLVEGEPARLPMPIESALVRIAQGAVSNVVRHADARLCVVTLTYGVDAVHLDIVDDGRGFDVGIVGDPAVHSFGLNSIRGRVEQLSGRWSIESEPGHTAMSATFPLIETGVTDDPVDLG